MSKHPLWLVLLGSLLAGGVLVYVAAQRVRRIAAPRPVGIASPIVMNPPQRPAVRKPAAPPAARAPAATAATQVCPPKAAMTEPEFFFFPPLIPSDRATTPRLFPDDRPATAPCLPDMVKLWTSRNLLESDRPGSDQFLSFLNKKKADDQSLTLGVKDPSHIGPQYPLIKDAYTTFLGRLSGGFTPERPNVSEGPQTPEVLLGCQYEHKLTQRTKVLGAVEYVRDLADLSHRRVNTQAAWEVLLDPEANLSLRTSVLEASKFTPNAEQAKNLNYSLDLIWKF